jgi:hypothetical protein
MKATRWMAVFVLVAAVTAIAGVRSAAPTATAQDFQIIDRDQGQVEPRLVEPPQGPFPVGPMPQMQPAAQPPVAMWGDDTHIYVLHGDRVFKIDKKSMKLVGEARLPLDQPGPPGPRGPMLREVQPRLDVGGGDRPRRDDRSDD